MRFDAHGVGGAEDLPIPAELAIAGASAALAVSFIVLALAWRNPRFNVGPSSDSPGLVERIGVVVDHAWFRALLRALGMAAFLYVGAAAVVGQDNLTNPFFGVFYVLLWIGIVPMSLVFGSFYKAISPLRTINLALAKLSGSDPDEGLRAYPERWGYWPAAFGLFAFVWMELVYPDNAQLGPVRLWFAAYVAVMLVGGAVFGNRFYERADPFEVYSTLVGRLSPWRREEGRLVVRSPLSNLDLQPVLPGLLAVCSVLLGSTAFDSFQGSSFWLTRIQSWDVNPTWANLAAMLALILLVGGLFTVATMATGVEEGYRRRDLPGQFAHSLVPIIVGYVFAHYLSYLVEYGQQTVIQASDPFGTGADYLGTGNRAVNYWLTLHPTTLSVLKVLAVVVGHVLAVIAAHDRAVKLLPRRHQLSGQLPLLLVMVGFTVGGLYLLFGS